MAVVVATVLATMVVPASAQAAFSVNGLVAQPAVTDAGAHSNFTLHVAFPDAGTNVKNLTIHLPPGMVGDPTATPLCAVTALNNDNCPANSRVGDVTTAVTAMLLPPVGLPLTVDGTLYNLTPQAGEPARFGIVLRPAGGLLGKIILQSAVKLRTTDYGLDTVINNIPKTANGIATHIDSMDVQLLGMAGNPPKPFMRNPTSCTVATTTFDAVAYNAATASGTASFTPTNCGALDFSPTFSSTIGSGGHTAAGTSPPLTTVVEQDVGEAGVNQVSVVLPDGITAHNEPLARQCSEVAFQAGTCPANTIVGDAKATSPLLTQALSGPVSIITPVASGQLPRLGLDLQGPLHIQLFGKFTLSADGPGNEFDGVPDIPLSRFKLHFAADDLVATSRDLCAPPAPLFPTSFLGWNGATQSGDVTVGVKGCGNSGGGKPTASIAVTHAKSKKPRLRLVVKEGTNKAATKIKRTKLRLPKRFRFAKGTAFSDGFRVQDSSAKISRKPRAATVKVSGATKLVEKAARGALLRRHRIAGRKLHFKLGVTDKSGKTTKLKLTAKAKP
jgi:hypothetical protein